MEMIPDRSAAWRWVRGGWLLFIFILLGTLATVAQTAGGKCAFKDGKMYLEVSKNITPAALEKFMAEYELSDLPIKDFLQTNSPDIWKQEGWVLEKNTPQVFIISKPLKGLGAINNPADKIISSEKVNPAAKFPAVSNRVVYGVNQFRNGAPFAVKDSVVTFVLANYTKARQVMLAGSFNNWAPTALPMRKTETGWEAKVSLRPGKYWYKFVVDENWITDPQNQIRENDGEGNTNSVFFKSNVVFRLKGYEKARRVYVAGSFNNWRNGALALQKTNQGWELPLYLAQGTHTYRFIVDGHWMADPDNKNQLPNEFNEYNSVIRLGRPHVFKLKGYSSASQVILSGSFNNWREDELAMQKTASGWELPYTLGPGNYEYRFKVDGKRLPDPENPLSISDKGRNSSSFLIINPNFTFRLPGHLQAQRVYLAGDFNNWHPTAFPMQKDQNGWYFQVHLAPGKTRYKYVVDNKWILDPGNKLWEQNEYGTGNSIIWLR